jgi:hypothetical protein
MEGFGLTMSGEWSYVILEPSKNSTRHNELTFSILSLDWHSTTVDCGSKTSHDNPFAITESGSHEHP